MFLIVKAQVNKAQILPGLFLLRLPGKYHQLGL